MSNKLFTLLLTAFLFCFLSLNIVAAEGQRGVTTDSELAGMRDIAATGGVRRI